MERNLSFREMVFLGTTAGSTLALSGSTKLQSAEHFLQEWTGRRGGLRATVRTSSLRRSSLQEEEDD